ncbi:MAG: hypothetical protein NTV06_05350, partial [candidate division Zixibacteria bacterium]|nr:hypothetical protein [candidate division Zixibacteria bacterium]
VSYSDRNRNFGIRPTQLHGCVGSCVRFLVGVDLRVDPVTDNPPDEPATGRIDGPLSIAVGV